MSILIIGAGGNIGRPLVRRLLEMGERPRLGVRDITKAKEQWGDQVKMVPFDFGNRATYETALEGIDQAFFIAVHPDPVSTVDAFLKISLKAGVKHIVFSSGRTTGDVAGKPLNTVEQLVQSCGMDWTILRPGWFMQNFVTWLGGTIRSEDKLFLPAGEAKTAFVDVRDIGEVAAAVLTEEAHAGKIYDLTGDKAFDHHEVCDFISQAAGRAITYVPQDRKTFLQTMEERGWTSQTALYTADLYTYVLSGKEEEVSRDIRGILHRPPRSLPSFTREYSDRF